MFAESLTALITDRVDPRSQRYISLLEQQHPWLSGLSGASTKAPSSLRPLLLGQALGMLFVEVTARCNERCIHCYAESTPERTEFLTTAEVTSTLEQARKLGRPFVQFTGGDPLIHQDLVAMVAHAHSLDFAGIEIYTNGLLLNPRLLAELSPYRPRLSFSIYADRADIHDAITRVPGSWQRTLNAMALAKDAGFTIRAGVVLMEENLDCAERMQDFLHRQLGLMPEQIHYDAANRVGRGHLLDLSTSIRIIPSHAPIPGEKQLGKLCLAANGDIYPCIFARSTHLGNIRQQSLSQILHELDQRPPAAPSSERWNSCLNELSCGDCRIAAYALGD